jgi:hypothetical protein
MPRMGRVEGNLEGWKWDEEGKYLYHPTYGRIQMVRVQHEDGKYHDQPVFVKLDSEFYIAVNEFGEIAFLEVTRPIALPPEKFGPIHDTWKPVDGEMRIPHPVDIHQEGVTHLELPRGLVEHASLREAEEETRRRVKEVAFLGYTNCDTSWFATSPKVFACMATLEETDVPPDPHEAIKRVLWLTPEEATKVETLDMATYACLFLFRRWALKQEDEWWHSIGSRL